MRGHLTRLARRLHGDSGAALITVMMFVLVVAAVGTIVTVAGVSGLSSANKDRAAAAAEATSDAGVAEAIAYIRSSGIGKLTCDEAADSEQPSGSCTTNVSWANNTAPQTVVPNGTGTTPASCKGVTTVCFQVWIGRLQKYSPPIGPPGADGSTPATPAIMRIHSTGFSGNGGARSVDVDVSVQPARFPLGMFGQTLSLNGTPNVYSESIFAAGNIDIKCPISGFDYQYGIPAAVHAAGAITYGPGNKCGYQGAAHPYSKNTANKYCNNASVPTPGDGSQTIFDQDGLGGPLVSGDGCYHQGAVYYPPASYPGSSATYPETSKFTADDLARYGYNPGGLTADQYNDLKAQAQALGTYYPTNPDPMAKLATLAAQGVRSPVLYYDFPSGNPGQVTPNLPDYYTRDPGQAAGCTQHSVTIIVRNGDVTYNVNSNLSPVVSIFAPEGSYDGQGNVDIIGTLFAQNVRLRGNQSFQLDPCFVNDPPGGVLSVVVEQYRTVDTGNVQ